VTFELTNTTVLAGGLVVVVCVVLLLRRVLTKFSSASVREDLTVSRGWLLEHQVRKDGE